MAIIRTGLVQDTIKCYSWPNTVAATHGLFDFIPSSLGGVTMQLSCQTSEATGCSRHAATQKCFVLVASPIKCHSQNHV